MGKQIIDERGNVLNFTLQTTKYKTNIKKGYPHYKGNARGSVTEKPLYEDNTVSLWLEYVISNEGEDYFWLMWYDDKGKTSMSMSSVFGKAEFIKLLESIKKIKIRNVEF